MVRVWIQMSVSLDVEVFVGAEVEVRVVLE